MIFFDHTSDGGKKLFVGRTGNQSSEILLLVAEETDAAHGFQKKCIFIGIVFGNRENNTYGFVVLHGQPGIAWLIAQLLHGFADSFFCLGTDRRMIGTGTGHG